MRSCYGSPVLIDYLESLNLEEVVVVSPDVGGVARARAFAKLMKDAPLAIIDKEDQLTISLKASQLLVKLKVKQLFS